MKRLLVGSFPVFGISVLVACGGGDSGGSGTMTLALTDAPVDGASQIVVEFTGVTVKPKMGSAIDFNFPQPVSQDLLALATGNTHLLLDQQQLPAGDYEWIRLNVNASCDSVDDSYVVTSTGQHELNVPSSQNTGLKLVSGFTVLQGGAVSFVIDWNARAGLVAPNGQQCYKLKPALRITDMAQYGTISGTVDAALLTAQGCTSDLNTGAGNAVYVYGGHGVLPDDIDGIDPEPLTTADVRLNDQSGHYEYSATFLPVGPYTVAFTCQAQDDNPPDPDNPQLNADDPIEFTAGHDVDVMNGETAVVDFLPVM